MSVKLGFYKINAIKVAYVIVRCAASLYEMKSSKLSLYQKKNFLHEFSLVIFIFYYFISFIISFNGFIL